MADQSLPPSISGKERIEDEDFLGRLGYKQELYRGLDSFMSVAFGVSAVGAVVAVVSTFSFGLKTGGPATMFWDWIGTFFMTLIVVSGMAEICSAYPNAGSVYYWAGNVAPRKWAAFASYWAGLWNLLGYVAVGAFYSYTFASFLNTALQYSGLSQLSEDYEVAIALSAAVVNLGLNCMRVDHVGYIANFAAVMQFGFVVAIVIVLFVMTPSFNSSEFVFFDYVNDTGFSSKSYVISVSLLFPIFAAFCAYDVSAHIAEETKQSRIRAPMALYYTVILSGTFTLLFVLALLYVIQDIDDAIDANNAAIEVIYQATNMTVATASAWIMVVLVFFVNVSTWTTAGRITYALCRDGIFPYSDYLAHVDENTKAPIRSLVLYTLLAMALILLALVGSTEFYSMAGICTFAFQVSYSIPFVFKVFLLCPTAKVMLETSPINLGRWSFAVSVISMIWLMGTAVLMTFPTESPVTAENMNYTSVVAAGVVVLGILNWELNTKGTFKGPKRSDDDESSDEEGVPTGSKSIGSKSPKESDPLLDKERRALL